MVNIEKEQILVLAKKYHSHQTRAGNVPYWYHVLSVGQIIQNAFSQTNEIDEEKLKIILVSAVGHDLYEDTDIIRDEIVDLYGKEVDELIQEVSHEAGDSKQKKFAQKIQNASEEAKIIKLADLVENTISVAYTLFDLGLTWLDDFYMPILLNMRPIVENSEYKKYPKTAQILISQLDFSCQRLIENRQKYCK